MNKEYKIKLSKGDLLNLIYLVQIRLFELQNKYDEYKDGDWFLYDNTICELDYTKNLLMKLKNVLEKEK